MEIFFPNSKKMQKAKVFWLFCRWGWCFLFFLLVLTASCCNKLTVPRLSLITFNTNTKDFLLPLWTLQPFLACVQPASSSSALQTFWFPHGALCHSFLVVYFKCMLHVGAPGLFIVQQSLYCFACARVVSQRRGYE